MLGSRFLIPGGAIAGGMPRWKWAANRVLTTLENQLMGTDLSELHTGYRAFSRELLLRCRSCATRWTSRSTPSC